MTKKNRVVAGIELGSSKIATVLAQVAVDPVTFDKSVSVIGVASSESRGIKKGQIVNIEEAVESAITSVEAAERMAGYNLDSAYVAIGGAHVYSQNSHGVVAVSDPNGEISPDDVGRVIEAAQAVSLPNSKEIIHILPREFSVDGETGVKDPVAMSGVRLEVDTHLVIASAAAVKNLRKAVGEVGVKIDGFVFAGLASARSVLTKTEKELGCVLIDIGGGTTSLAVYIDGSLAHSAEIPIGGQNVTSDLAIGMRVSLETAEKVKRALSANKKDLSDKATKLDLASLGVAEAGSYPAKTLVDGIIRPRLNEIFTMVRLELERAKALNRTPSGAIITGGAGMTVGVADAAKKALAMPVRLGKPRGVTGLVDDILSPDYATPLGLVLYGSDDEEVTSSAPGFVKKFKLPTKGMLGKLMESVKDLLP